MQRRLRQLYGAIVVAPTVGGQSHGKNNHNIISRTRLLGGQGEALYRLAAVDAERVTVEIEGPIVLRTAALVAIRCADGDRFSRVVLRREPIADALGNRGSRVIGVGDGE